MLWARMVAYVTGTVNQELLLRNEYLGAENRILRGQIKGRLLLSEGEKPILAEIAHRLGREALENLAAMANPDTILGWYRKFIANKFEGSRFRGRAGRPRSNEEIERLDRPPERVNFVNALKAASWAIITRSDSLFTLDRRVHNLAIVHPTDFSPTSVQFKSEINGGFLCKRHQKQDLEFLTAFLRTRRPGVRIPPGAPLLANKTKAI
jgi:hypothetical protein